MIKILLYVFFFAGYFSFNACSNPVSAKGDNNAVEVEGLEHTKANDATAAESGDKEVAEVYSKAIKDYIEAVYQLDKKVLDTLFILKRQNGQEDDFPDIQLPQKINKTSIILLTQKDADLRRDASRKATPFINLIGNVDDNNADFIFVAFYPGFTHQMDAYINYKYDKLKKEYVLDQLSIEVVMYDKNKKPSHMAIYENGKHKEDRPTK